MTPGRVTAWLRRFADASPRDLLIVVLPLLLVLVAGFWGASRFIRPAPPDRLVLASGGTGGAYQRFAALYTDVLARQGITLVEQPSAGALDNLARLRDSGQIVDAGLYQGGVGEPSSGDDLQSLGAFYYEPLWIFYRDALAPRGGALDRVLSLKGRRIAVGAPGSGTRQLAMEVLRGSGIDAGNATLLDKGGPGLVEAFGRGEIDAAFVVGATQSATVWSLLFADGVRLMSLAHADAYTRQLPYLSKVVLPRGAIDLVRDLPKTDVTLVASTASVLVREDTHPALVGLLLQAASEAHGGAGLFNRAGEFPRAETVDFPLSKEAERYYKSGKPFLQRYLPFWAATLVDRLVVMLIPLVALLLPILRFAPALYSWVVRTRIFRSYGELKRLESEMTADPAQGCKDAWLARLDAIERNLHRTRTPLAFSDLRYNLRTHIDLVRERIRRGEAIDS